MQREGRPCLSCKEQSQGLVASAAWEGAEAWNPPGVRSKAAPQTPASLHLARPHTTAAGSGLTQDRLAREPGSSLARVHPECECQDDTQDPDSTCTPGHPGRGGPWGPRPSPSSRPHPPELGWCVHSGGPGTNASTTAYCHPRHPVSQLGIHAAGGTCGGGCEETPEGGETAVPKLCPQAWGRPSVPLSPAGNRALTAQVSVCQPPGLGTGPRPHLSCPATRHRLFRVTQYLGGWFPGARLLTQPYKGCLTGTRPPRRAVNLPPLQRPGASSWRRAGPRLMRPGTHDGHVGNTSP